jgi:hypothetical protein
VSEPNCGSLAENTPQSVSSEGPGDTPQSMSSEDAGDTPQSVSSEDAGGTPQKHEQSDLHPLQEQHNGSFPIRLESLAVDVNGRTSVCLVTE